MFSILAVAFLPLLSTAQEVASDKQLVGLDFFAKIKAVSQVKTIGDDIFFVLRQANVKADSYSSDLYQLVDGKEDSVLQTD